MDKKKKGGKKSKEPKQVKKPAEQWSTREKLCLVSSVQRRKDRNWSAISKDIKPFAEPGRPKGWFSAKSCAAKYTELVKAATSENPEFEPGSKSSESVDDAIIRQHTTERISEIKMLLNLAKKEHRELKREAELIQSGQLDDKLETMWEDIKRKEKVEGEEGYKFRIGEAAASPGEEAGEGSPQWDPYLSMSSSTTDESSLSSDDRPSFSGKTRSKVLSEPSGSGKNKRSDRKSLKKPSKENVSPSFVTDSRRNGKILGAKTSPGANASGVSAATGRSPAASPGESSFTEISGSPKQSDVTRASTTMYPQPMSFYKATFAPANQVESLANADMDETVPTVTPNSLGDSYEQSPDDAEVPGFSEDEEDTNVLGPAVDEEMIDVEFLDIEEREITDEEDVHEEEERPGQKELCEGGKMPGDEVPDNAVPEEEEDRMNASYVGEELDLKTVKDIIAIIEEKANEVTETLDAAAVEAALSFCEDEGNTLPETWDDGLFQQAMLTVAPQKSPVDRCLQGSPRGPRRFQGSVPGTDLPVLPMESRSFFPTSSSSRVSNTSKYAGTSAPPHGQDDGQGYQDNSPDDSKSKHAHQSEEQLKFKKTSKPVETVGKGEENDVETEAEEIVSLGASEDQKSDGMEESLSDGAMEVEPGASGNKEGCGAPKDSDVTSSSSSPQLEAEQHKIWKKSIMLVWRAIATHRFANVFLHPVKEEIAPGYHRIVKRPMDLQTIKRNIESGVIRTTAAFQRDIMLMFQNALMYNNHNQEVYRMTMEMQHDVMEYIQQFLTTQLMLETFDSSSMAKRHVDKNQEDSMEQDSVVMSSPAFLISLFDGCSTMRRSAMEADSKMKK